MNLSRAENILKQKTPLQLRRMKWLIEANRLGGTREDRDEFQPVALFYSLFDDSDVFAGPEDVDHYRIAHQMEDSARFATAREFERRLVPSRMLDAWSAVGHERASFHHLVDALTIHRAGWWPDGRGDIIDNRIRLYHNWAPRVGVECLDRATELEHFERILAGATDPSVLGVTCQWDVIRDNDANRCFKIVVISHAEVKDNPWGEEWVKKQALVERLTYETPDRHKPPLGYYLLEMVTAEGKDASASDNTPHWKDTPHLQAFIQDLVACDYRFTEAFKLLHELELVPAQIPILDWQDGWQRRVQVRPKAILGYPTGFVPYWPLDPIRDIEIKLVKKSAPGSIPDRPKTIRLEKLPWPVDFSFVNDQGVNMPTARVALSGLLFAIESQWAADQRSKAAPGLMFFYRNFDAFGSVRSQDFKRDQRSVRCLMAVTPQDAAILSAGGEASSYAYYKRTREGDAEVQHDLRELLAQYLHFPSGSKQKHIVFWFENMDRPRLLLDEDKYPGEKALWTGCSPQGELYQKLYNEKQLLVVRVGYHPNSYRQLQPHEISRYAAIMSGFSGLDVRNLRPVMDMIAEAQADRFGAGVILPQIQRLSESKAARTVLGDTTMQTLIKSNLGGKFEPNVCANPGCGKLGKFECGCGCNRQYCSVMCAEAHWPTHKLEVAKE